MSNDIESVKQAADIAQPFKQAISLTLNYLMLFVKLEIHAVELIEPRILLRRPDRLATCILSATIESLELDTRFLAQLQQINFI